MRSTAQFSLGVRLENALVAYAMYLMEDDLAVAFGADLSPSGRFSGSMAGWAIAFGAGRRFRNRAAYRSKRYLLTGWLWFLGTLVPVIGLVQVGDQAMADRYAYIPLIGIFVMIVWGLADLADSRNLGSQCARHSGRLLVLLGLSVATYRQLSFWASNYDLWTHALAVTDKNFIAQDNLGGALLLLNKPDEAYLALPGCGRNQSTRSHEPLQSGRLSSGAWARG